MAWTIRFDPRAERDLAGLGREEAKRIARTLRDRIALLDDPRKLGDALAGGWSGYWRYRVGDYRVIARIEDAQVTILVVRVAHRRQVYR